MEYRCAGSTVLEDPEAFYVIRSVAEAIDLVMVTDEIYVFYPSEHPSTHLILTFILMVTFLLLYSDLI